MVSRDLWSSFFAPVIHVRELSYNDIASEAIILMIRSQVENGSWVGLLSPLFTIWTLSSILRWRDGPHSVWACTCRPTWSLEISMVRPTEFCSNMCHADQEYIAPPLEKRTRTVLAHASICHSQITTSVVPAHGFRVSVADKRITVYRFIDILVSDIL
jgi:hypothetical protein